MTVRLSAGLAEVLDLPHLATLRTVAAALARVSGLPPPVGPASQRVLAEIVVALQHHVIDNPHMPMDRAIVAHTSISHGCLATGEDAVRATLDELGTDSLDWYVRGALHSTIAPALAERGLIRLVGG